MENPNNIVHKDPKHTVIGFGWLKFYIFMHFLQGALAFIFGFLFGIKTEQLPGRSYAFVLGVYFLVEAVALMKRTKLGIYLVYIELAASVFLSAVILSMATQSLDAAQGVALLLVSAAWLIYFSRRESFFGLQKGRPFSRTKIIVPIILICFGLVLGVFLKHQQNSMTRVLKTAEWKRYSVGNNGMSLESPMELKPQGSDLPASAKASITDYETYGFSGGVVELFASSFKVVEAYDLDKGVEGMIKELSGAFGVLDPEHEITNVVISGKKGKFFKAKFQYIDTPHEAQGFLVVNDKRVWQLMVSFESTELWAREASERILSSAIIDDVVGKS